MANFNIMKAFDLPVFVDEYATGEENNAEQTDLPEGSLTVNNGNESGVSDVQCTKCTKPTVKAIDVLTWKISLQIKSRIRSPVAIS